MFDQKIIDKHQKECDKARQRLKDVKIFGEWIKEKDRIVWENQGLTCLMVRATHSFTWCGYVGLPPGHPLYGQDYYSADVSVHGGVTYGEHCQGKICHKPRPGEPDELYWLGFDCSHGGDRKPNMQFSLGFESDEQYRNEKYVQAEVNNLARQLKAA